MTSFATYKDAAAAQPKVAADAAHHAGAAPTRHSPQAPNATANIAPITTAASSLAVNAWRTDKPPKCVTRLAPDAFQRGPAASRATQTATRTGSPVTTGGRDSAQSAGRPDGPNAVDSSAMIGHRPASTNTYCARRKRATRLTR